MTMEEILAVVQKIKDAWVAFGQSMAEAAQALEDMFRNLGESDELWPKRNGIPPKKVWHVSSSAGSSSSSSLPVCPRGTSNSALPAACILRNKPSQRLIFCV